MDNFPASRKEISDRQKADVASNLEGSNPYLRNSFLQALIFGLSGRLFALYNFSKNGLTQCFWHKAKGIYLEEHAANFKITKNPATKSIGYIVVPGNNNVNIPNTTTWQTSNGKSIKCKTENTISENIIEITSLTQNAGIATAVMASNHNLAPNIEIIITGVSNEDEYNGTKKIISTPTAKSFQFSVNSSITSPATGVITALHTTAYIEVESVETGKDNNLDEGESLTITSSISGVEDTAYAAFEGLSGGSDIEDINTDLRDRFLYRVQNPVALFNESAITVEAKKVSGVTRVWVKNVDDTIGSIIPKTNGLTNEGNGVAIFETEDPHGIEDGQRVTIIGANESEYNVEKARLIKLDDNRIAYAISGTPDSPATGSIAASYSLVEEGQLKVLFVRDNDDNIIPSSLEVQDVKNKILEIKPGNDSDADIIVKAPTPLNVQFNFLSILPNTETMKDAVKANLQAYFLKRTEPGKKIPAKAYNAIIYQTVDPETLDRITDYELSSPTSDIEPDREELPIIEVNFA